MKIKNHQPAHVAHWSTSIIPRGSLVAGIACLLMNDAFAAEAATPGELTTAFNGVWLLEGAAGPAKTVDGATPPLLPDAQRLYDERKQARANGDDLFDQATWCASAGLPRLMLEKYPFEIMVNDKQTAFMYEWNRWARLVDMKDNKLEPYYSMSFGTANGHFEGAVLVVETKGIMETTFIDNSGLPHGENLVMTERLRLLAPDLLENRIRFEDPDTYAEPWETIVNYRRQTGAEIREDVCLDRIKQGKPAI